jgi:exopolysaccharide biosynthesis polyprenyl glycosylphosphotransferase
MAARCSLLGVRSALPVSTVILRPGRDGAAALGRPDIQPADLRAAVDERTRTLLNRRRRARRGWLLRRSLLAADVVGLVLVFALVLFAYGGEGLGRHGALRAEIAAFLLTLPGWPLVAKLHGLYDRDEENLDYSTVDDVVGVFHLVTICCWLLFAGCLLIGVGRDELERLATFWLAAVLILPMTRAVARSRCRRTASFQQNTIIVGAGEVGQLVARKLIKHPEYGINVVGFLDPHPKARRTDLPEHLTVFGDTDRLPEIVERLDIERVIVAFTSEPEPETLDQIRRLSARGVQVDLVPRLFEVVGPRVVVHSVEGLPLIGLPPVRLTPSSRLLKRSLDVVVASLGLLFTAPLFGIIAVLIRRDSAGPVLFRQTRLGLGRRKFTALKFRTMRVDTDEAAHKEFIRRTMGSRATAEANGLYKLDRTDAVTRVGRWLRRTSLDELPQLINVLRGEMSIVGPRPCIPYETEHFEWHHYERFLMPQGITGLWQVTARANSTFGEALDMDVAYVRGWSLGLDLRLLLRTPLQLLRQRSATR